MSLLGSPFICIELSGLEVQGSGTLPQPVWLSPAGGTVGVRQSPLRVGCAKRPPMVPLRKVAWHLNWVSNLYHKVVGSWAVKLNPEPCIN